jgi:hypothetical protein
MVRSLGEPIERAAAASLDVIPERDREVAVALERFGSLR